MISELGQTSLYQFLLKEKSLFIGQIDDVFKYATSMLPKINLVFSNYTGHGVEHSFAVMEYMYHLIEDIQELSQLEITCLIYAALLHDIGMVANDDEINLIKRDDTSLVNRKYSLVLEKYQNEVIALQECIRPVHGTLSKAHIHNHIDNNYFNIPGSTNITFKEEIEEICVAHNENFDWIVRNLLSDISKGEYKLNAQYIAMLLRISDYLDIDENRAPLHLYKYLDPKDFSNEEWKKHFVIENTNKIVRDEKTGYKHIEFYGSSEDPKTHRMLLKYFDSINEELNDAVCVSESFT